MALDVLEQIQEQSCHGDFLQAPPSPPPPQNSAEESSTSQQQVDSFLREAVNSRNRITVLRLEQEIEKFARNPNLQDLLLKAMHSSYERLAAHRIAQHYGLQSMVVTASFPKVSRILLVKTSESNLPSVRLADIPLDSASEDKSASVPKEKFAIKQRASRASNEDGFYGSADSGRVPPKTMEEREEEYDKARARIFNSGDAVSPVHGEVGVSDGVDSLKTLESSLLSRSLSSSSMEGKSLVLNSNRVAIFRDREKDMKDPDYDRSYKRYSQPLDSGMSSFCPSLQRVYAPVNPYEKYTRLDGPWGPQLQADQAPYMSVLHYRGPWVESGYPDISYTHYGQGHSDMYLQCQRFPSHSGHYNHMKDGFHYSFQHGLQASTTLGTLGR